MWLSVMVIHRQNSVIHVLVRAATLSAEVRSKDPRPRATVVAYNEEVG